MRDLYVQDEWTRRFAEMVDKHIDLSEADNLLYINAGTGTHALTLDEKWGEKTDIFGRCEDEDLVTIARDKGAAVSSKVDFSMIDFEDEAFDAVLADAGFVKPADLAEFVADAAMKAKVGGDVAVFLPASGSFGEVFSLVWEVLLNEDLGSHGAAAESLITELPSQEALERIAERAGMVNIHVETANEIFEYDDGAAFVSSPLVEDFLMPAWLEMLSEEEKERVTSGLARLIDEEDGSLTFRFSVKAALLTGERG